MQASDALEPLVGWDAQKSERERERETERESERETES